MKFNIFKAKLKHDLWESKCNCLMIRINLIKIYLITVRDLLLLNNNYYLFNFLNVQKILRLSVSMYMNCWSITSRMSENLLVILKWHLLKMFIHSPISKHAKHGMECYIVISGGQWLTVTAVNRFSVRLRLKIFRFVQLAVGYKKILNRKIIDSVYYWKRSPLLGINRQLKQYIES